VCAKIKKEGKGAVVHKEPVARQDLQKLYTSFYLETSEGLQNKVCNRGRENLRELEISDFAFRAMTMGAGD
jgi:hypothetical protein